jgi:hypothetical protein
MKQEYHLENYFRNVKLHFTSEFLLPLLTIVVENMENFQTNSDIRNINTRHKRDLHMPNTNNTSYQKAAYYVGIKLFSTVPARINILNHGVKAFI